MTTKKNPSPFYLSLISFLLLCFSYCSFFSQQLPFDHLDTCKKYKSIEQALKNPDLVYVLDLSKKKLTKIPKEISFFKNLHVLKLSKNKLSTIDSSIVFPKHILEINLSKNQLEEIPEAILATKSLKRLIANQNSIKSIPENISKLKSLAYLDLWSNDLSEVSENIKFLTSLKELDLRVILFSNSEKDRIKSLLPNTTIYFSNSCNCGY